MVRKSTGNGARTATKADIDVGNRIRAFRMERDLSQEEVARQLGVSFQQMQKYERGVNRLTIGRLIQMCKAFKATPHQILGWGEPAVKLDRHALDPEAFKLARSMDAVRADLKAPLRHLIDKLPRQQ